MAQIYLLTGENVDAIREERRRWTDEFSAKHGPENLARLDAQGLTYRALLDEISVMPFIAERRLVVVAGVPRFDREEVERLPGVIHPACILLFVESSPDKRLGGVKALLEIATVKTFPLLKGKQLRDWMTQFGKARGTTLSSEAAEALETIVGEDQGMLRGEIEKLALFSESPTRADVERLAVPSGEREIWHLQSLIAAGDAVAALRYAKALQSHGEDPVSLWNILLWIVRGLTAVGLAAAEGHRNPAKVASAAGVPFPTARTLLGAVSRADVASLRRLVDWAAAADIELKTGGYRMSADAREEIQSLIDECVVRSCALTSGVAA